MRAALRIALASFVTLLADSPALAGVQSKLVEYKHGEVVLEGYLAWDDGASETDKRPGIVVCPEWWGNNEYARGRAEKLASLGYVALAIDLYGKGKLTTDAKQASAWSGELYGDPALMRARARAGLDQLLAQPMVDGTRLAAIGYCFGGTVALELARTGADLDAVVAFHAGKLSSLGEPQDNARIKGAVLACHGQADAFVPDEELARFHDQMKSAEVYYQFVSYPGAVHAFTTPAADAAGIKGVAYDARADEHSWATMRCFFDLAFGATSAR